MKNFSLFIGFLLLTIFILNYSVFQTKQQIENYENIRIDILKTKDYNTQIQKKLLILKTKDFKHIKNLSNSMEDLVYTEQNNIKFKKNYKLIENLKNLKKLILKRDNFFLDLKSKLKRFDLEYKTLWAKKPNDFSSIQIYKELIRLTPHTNLDKFKNINNSDKNKVDSLLQIIRSIQQSQKDISSLKINTNIENINNQINEKIKKFSDTNKKITQGTIFLFMLIITIFSIYYIREYKKNLMNKRYRNAVENSDNIIIVTDYNQKILYVNESFTKSTGYTLEDLKGKTPAILKSSVMPKTFYKELNKTIYSGKKWQGEFINKDKNGHTKYEKASILPISDSSGKIKYFLSIKFDITKEVEANQKIKEHEQTILHQSKMAAMGEMIHNIAHQWRQPLSTITTITSGMSMQKEIGILSDEQFSKSIDTIMENANHLSKTIDDFRNFFKSDKECINVNLKESISKALNISSSKLQSVFIESINSLNDINVKGIDVEIMQVIVNLYSNSINAFDPNDNKIHYIFTELYEKNEAAVIKVRDNAGGIPENIIYKIFEPYFTTKHKAQGTGIGLYMCHEIIKNTFKGTIDVHNVTYKYKEETLHGAEFIIKIPI